MKTEHDTLIRALDALLDVERRALLDGDLAALAGLVEEKERLIDALNKAEFEDQGTLSPVNDKVRRNQALLEEALSGIRSVARRLAEIRQTRKSFDTYDRLGQKNRIEAGATSSVEKRA
jgi:flagellar biosynthesis/type III secretory pathway chaperone